MQLNQEEQDMLNGAFGEPAKWAIEHMLQVGRMFDAEDFVPVSQAHMMADPESLGDAGVSFLEQLANHGPEQSQVRIPMITDPRGVDLEQYQEMGQTEQMAELERRTIAACEKLGILMTNTCINYQITMPPVQGDHVAYGDTGVVIYSNSVLGARSNFEGGPSALAAGLTGRTPRYGLHLDQKRQATRRFVVKQRPENLTDWGLLGGEIGRRCNSYWEVPVIQGIDTSPTSDELKHFGAAMASFGSTPLFHVVGITPEAHSLESVCQNGIPDAEEIFQTDLDALQGQFGHAGDKVDVVVFAAPQLSIVELSDLAKLLDGKTRHPQTDMIVCTAPGVAADSKRLGLTRRIEKFGAKMLTGTCFYNQYAKEIGEANGWVNILSNSTKIVNIISGYGYQPALRSMAECVDAAVAGEIQ